MYKLPLTELAKFLELNNAFVPYHKLTIYDQVIETMKLPHIKTEMMNDYFNCISGPKRRSSEIFLYDSDDRSRTIRQLGFNNRLINDMNMFNLLPNELVLLILTKVDYNSVNSFCLVNQEFYFYQRKIIKLKQQINKFPRPEGKCKFHRIPKDVIEFADISYTTSKESNLHKCAELAVNTLDLDLVRGDIIQFGDNDYWCQIRMIYNGDKFVDLAYMSPGNDSLPIDYENIIDDVPINYWQEFEQINFKLANVLDQCVNNIQCGKITSTKSALFTTFVVNNLTYKIIYDVEPDLKYKMEFIRVLNCVDNNYNFDYDSDKCPDKFTVFLEREESVNYKYVETGADKFIHDNGNFRMNHQAYNRVLKSDSEL